MLKPPARSRTDGMRILRWHLLLLLFLAGYIFVFGRCPIRWLFGIPCPGCGLTRACLSALQLDFPAAFTYHPLFWLILPAGFILIHQQPLGLPGGKRLRLALCILLAVSFTGFYLYRLFWEHNPLFAVDFKSGALYRLFSFITGG